MIPLTMLLVPAFYFGFCRQSAAGRDHAEPKNCVCACLNFILYPYMIFSNYLNVFFF